MIRMFLAVFGAAFFVLLGGMSYAPNLVLGAYQDDLVATWTEAGVDTSACDKSIPSLGIGVRECIEGSMKDLVRQIEEANEEGEDRWRPEE